MSSRFNFVIFGASGLTGKYVVKEFHRVSKKENFTWAIAGRSQSKLEEIITNLQIETGDNDLAKIKIIIANTNDMDSLKEMTKQADILINCCGPFQFYGEPVIKACIETKTHQIDVACESVFIESMELKYDEAAKKAGIYIISACGLECVAQEMAIAFLEKEFKGVINTVEGYLYTWAPIKYRKPGSPVIHYGSWQTWINSIAERKQLEAIREQIYPDFPDVTPKLQDRFVIHKSEIAGHWCLPIPGSDKSVPYRTQYYFYKHDKKRPIQFKGYVASTFLHSLIVLLVSMVVFLMASFDYGRKMLLKYPRIFGLGVVSAMNQHPSDELYQNTDYAITFFAEGWKNNESNVNGKPIDKTMKMTITGKNPGYGATSTILMFTGLALLKEIHKVPGNGGVLTSGVAFSRTQLLENLHKNGMSFKLIE